MALPFSPMKNHWTNGLHVKELIQTYQPRTILELGALFGENTAQYLELRETQLFHLKTISTGELDGAFYEVREADKNNRDYEWCNGVSYDTIPHLKDGLIEFCSIDTYHSSEVLEKELSALLPKLFPRCIIVFHDTISFPELRQTVLDFINDNEGFMVLRESAESCGAMAISRLLDIKYTV